MFYWISSQVFFCTRTLKNRVTCERSECIAERSKIRSRADLAVPWVSHLVSLSQFSHLQNEHKKCLMDQWWFIKVFLDSHWQIVSIQLFAVTNIIYEVSYLISRPKYWRYKMELWLWKVYFQYVISKDTSCPFLHHRLLLTLTEEEFSRAPYTIENSSHRRAILMELERVKALGVKPPQNLWEYKVNSFFFFKWKTCREQHSDHLRAHCLG